MEIYLDKEKTKPFTDYKVDGFGYANLKKGTYFVFGDSKIHACTDSIIYAHDKVEVFEWGNSEIHICSDEVIIRDILPPSQFLTKIEPIFIE